MTAMLIDSGVDTAADLRGLLPASLRDSIAPELVEEWASASALRVLVTIKNPFWHGHVHGANIDWPALLDQARSEHGTTDSVLVRAEIAASLAGYPDSRVTLLYAARALDAGSFAAFMDALRIANTGLSSTVEPVRSQGSAWDAWMAAKRAGLSVAECDAARERRRAELRDGMGVVLGSEAVA